MEREEKGVVSAFTLPSMKKKLFLTRPCKPHSSGCTNLHKKRKKKLRRKILNRAAPHTIGSKVHFLKSLEMQTKTRYAVHGIFISHNIVALGVSLTHAHIYRKSKWEINKKANEKKNKKNRHEVVECITAVECARYINPIQSPLFLLLNRDC